ncbi:hypothetical protein Q3G72_013307 [Acer saccharum]|nr:hypothetical protein Q3G72_013307 [Acer saccharum]
MNGDIKWIANLTIKPPETQYIMNSKIQQLHMNEYIAFGEHEAREKGKGKGKGKEKEKEKEKGKGKGKRKRKNWKAKGSMLDVMNEFREKNGDYPRAAQLLELNTTLKGFGPVTSVNLYNWFKYQRRLKKPKLGESSFRGATAAARAASGGGGGGGGVRAVRAASAATVVARAAETEAASAAAVEAAVVAAAKEAVYCFVDNLDDLLNNDGA